MKAAAIDQIWETRGDIVPLKRYRWSKPAFVVVGTDLLSLVLPSSFGSTPWELLKSEVVGLSPEGSPPDPDQVEALVASGVLSFDSPYLFTTGPAAPETVALQTWLPVMTPRLRYFAVNSPNSPLQRPLWPDRRAVLYGVSLREERPGQLLEVLQRRGWTTASPQDLFPRRRQPFADADIVHRWKRANRLAYLARFAPMLLMMLAAVLVEVVGLGEGPVMIGALVLAISLFFAPRQVERRTRWSIEQALVPDIASSLGVSNE